jgi:hypothetical protein
MKGMAPAWQQGQSGNPGGKTSEQRQREIRNAEMATRLHEHMLEREVALIDEPVDLRNPEIVAALKGIVTDKQLEAIVSHMEMTLTNERLKLIKDAQDRGLGSPKEYVEMTNNAVIPTPLPPGEWIAEHGDD